MNAEEPTRTLNTDEVINMIPSRRKRAKEYNVRRLHLMFFVLCTIVVILIVGTIGLISYNNIQRDREIARMCFSEGGNWHKGECVFSPGRK